MASSKPLKVSISIGANNQTAPGMAAAARTISNTLGKATKSEINQAHKLAAAWAGVRGRITAASSALRGSWAGGFAGGMGGSLLDGLGIGGLLSGGGAAAALISGTNGLIERGAQLDDLNKRTGLSAELLGELSYAAKLAGLELPDVAKGVGKLSANLFDLEHAKGGGKLGQFLAEFGPETAKALKGMNVSDATTYLLNLIGIIEDTPKRLKLASAVFGKGSAGLMAQFAVDLAKSGGFEKVRQEARQTGAVLSSEIVTKLADADDAIGKFKASLSGAFARSAGGSGIIDSIIGVMNKLTAALSDQNSPISKSLTSLSSELAKVNWPELAGNLLNLTKSAVKITSWIAKNFGGGDEQSTGQTLGTAAAAVTLGLTKSPKLAAGAYAAGRVTGNAVDENVRPYLNSFNDQFNSYQGSGPSGRDVALQKRVQEIYGSGKQEITLNLTLPPGMAITKPQPVKVETPTNPVIISFNPIEKPTGQAY